MEIAGRDGRTEEASNPSVRVREEGRGRVKCPKSMQISPHSTSNAAASDRFCGLGQEFDCNLRMVNSEWGKGRSNEEEGVGHAGRVPGRLEARDECTERDRGDTCALPGEA